MKMWNLIKNVFRSLRFNKVSVIGLTFLTFLSIGIFTVLNSTSNSIMKEYQTITKSGNLHDFTVNENYNIGNINYSFDANLNPPRGSNDTFEDYMGTSSDGKDIPWYSQSDNSDGTWSRTYQLSIDISNIDQDSLVYQFVSENNGVNWENSSYDSYLHPVITVTSSKELTYEDGSTDKKSTYTYEQVIDDINGVEDSGQITSAINQISIDLMNLITSTDTPMENYLDVVLKDQVTWRNFKSILVDNSPDNITYKLVNSDPTDTIDKIWSNNGATNFNIADFNPLTSNDEYKSIVPSTAFPTLNDFMRSMTTDASNWPSDPNSSQQLNIRAFFYLLSKGSEAALSSDSLGNTIKNAIDNCSTTWDKSSYDAYYEVVWKDGATSLHEYTNKNYKYNIQWSATDNWNIVDWTSWFAIVNPEFTQAKNLKPVNLSDIVTTQYPNVTISSKQDFIDWINSISETDRDTWFQNAVSKYPNNVVNPGGGIPFFILDSGITPDFIYPIIDIQHSIPNVDKECIIFGNTNSYYRIFDAFRGNPTENYLVGKFNSGVDQTKILNQINEQATTIMNYPTGTQVAYLANDTNDVFNAASFRIAYIPKLISKIQYISVSLTIFVLVLSLFICAIVIRRFINNSRVSIGVMRANGINRRSIAVSLIPFALIPSVLGGIFGYVVGILLQTPTALMFKNYWMLPTPLVSFNIWIMLIAILVPFIIFMVVSIVSTLLALREKPTDLMKASGDYKTNFISRRVKMPLSRFNILTRFRASVAFSSIWKLIILIVMVSLSMSSLAFGITMSGKFDYVKNATFSSRNYKYAVDLMTPTDQSGQYIPIDATRFGESGFVKTTDGYNWVPNTNYDDYFYQSKDGGDEPLVQDDSYRTIFKNPTTDDHYDEYYGIPKMYYSFTYDLYDIEHDIFDTKEYGQLERSFSVKNSDTDPTQNYVAGTSFYPMMSDSTGQAVDLLYLKNRSSTESSLNYTVGVPGIMTSNPWNIAISLMPENNKNLCDSRTNNVIQQLGLKAGGYINGNVDKTNLAYDSNNPYGTELNNDWWNGEDNPKYAQFFIATPTDSSNEHFTYTLNNAYCVDSPLGMCITPDFISFLNKAYATFEIKSTNDDNGALLASKDYQIMYNKIPLNSDDETYSYLSATGTKKDSTYSSDLVPPANSRILGIKENSMFVKLVDVNGNDLSSLINDNNTFDLTNDYPLIVNQYAAYKYHLTVGNKISFMITNKSNRYEEQIKKGDYDPTTDPTNLVTFKIVGINNTYEGEEYFTNQQLVNKLLGLRSKMDTIDKQYSLHNYYVNSDVIPSNPLDDLTNNNYWPKDEKGQLTTPSDTPIVTDLANLGTQVNERGNPYSLNGGEIFSDDYEKNGYITPYGFNGVFTYHNDGSAILNGGLPLYSLSGLYSGTDNLSSDAFKNILKVGVNLETANIITGFYQQTDPDSIGYKIQQAYEKCVSSNHSDDSYNDLIALIDPFVTELVKVYGSTSVNYVISTASDNNSTEKIFTNMSATITQIESVVLSVITVMVTLIVMLITIMLINDAKKLAAILKALGYSDQDNIRSFLSIYAPVIVLGLAIAIPFTIALINIFQAAIFSGAQILLTTTIPWYAFPISLGFVAIVLTLGGISSYYSLRKDRLVDMIKD